MTDLAYWLLEQITEDEAAARGEEPGAWGSSALATPHGDTDFNYGWLMVRPSRIIAECTAKRNIIADWIRRGGDFPCYDCGGQDDTILRHLAQPYADRPGYQEEWRP